jgi:hypothetical protein
MTLNPKSRPEPERPRFAWKSWPVRDRPRTLALVVPVVGAALGAVWFATGEAAWVGGAAFLLALGLADYFAPVEYALDERGAEARYVFWTRRMPWARVRGVRVEKNGVFLSPFPAPSRLENHRGLFLRFADNRDHVADALRRFRPE